MVYKKKYILVLVLFLTQSSEKIGNVLSDKGVFYYLKEAAFGKHLGLGRQGSTLLWLEGWNFQSSAPLRLQKV